MKHNTQVICAKCGTAQALELFWSVECFSKTQNSRESENPHRPDFPLKGFEWVFLLGGESCVLFLLLKANTDA